MMIWFPLHKHHIMYQTHTESIHTQAAYVNAIAQIRQFYDFEMVIWFRRPILPPSLRLPFLFSIIPHSCFNTYISQYDDNKDADDKCGIVSAFPKMPKYPSNASLS